MDLYHIPTCELVDELATREGVTEYPVPPAVEYDVTIWSGGEDGRTTEGTPHDSTGPARILVVVD